MGKLFLLEIKYVVLLFFSASVYGQEIGLQLYSLRNHIKEDPEKILATIQKWGISKLEDGNDGTLGYGLEGYKKLLDKYQLEIVSVSATFEELQDTPNAVLERAKVYGSKYAVCFWIPHKDTIFGIEEVEKALGVFNAAGQLLKENGITLVYHPHGYEFRPYMGMTLMDHMIKEADHFDFEMDVYWFAHPGEDPITWLKRYPEKFKLMHLKDCKKGTVGNLIGRSDVETNVVLGTGQIAIAEIVKEAKKMGLEYLFIEDESSHAKEQIPESIEYLKKIMD